MTDSRDKYLRELDAYLPTLEARVTELERIVAQLSIFALGGAGKVDMLAFFGMLDDAADGAGPPR